MNVNKLALASTPKECIIHWALAGSLIILFVSGSALAFPFLGFFSILFGGVQTMKVIHHGVGILFACSLVAVAFIWWKDCLFEADDIEWLKKAGGYIIRTKDIPKMAKFNAGQKIFFWYTLFFGIIASTTGFVMLYPSHVSSPFLTVWSYPAHTIAYAMFGVGWLGHWYLGVFANPGSLSSIISGWVPLSWIRHHRAKWPIKRVKVILYGELTEAIVTGLKEKLDDFLHFSWETMILDCKNVTIIDEKALAFLATFLKAAQEVGNVKITGPHPELSKLLKQGT